MSFHPALALLPAARTLLLAVLATLAAGCLGGGGDDAPPPGPPPQAYVGIDDPPSRVETARITLQGEGECPGCSASDWQHGSCPAISCPDATGLDIRWTNQSLGEGGPATHGITPVCHCPVFSGGYCYTACNHVWWATVPLAYGVNQVQVFSDAPGFATGSATAAIERVPLAPTWLPAQPGAGSLSLSWSPVADATSYNLYWSTTPYGWSDLMTPISGVTSPYLHVGLQSGVTHYYYVTALVGAAESFDSLQLGATPD